MPGSLTGSLGLGRGLRVSVVTLVGSFSCEVGRWLPLALLRGSSITYYNRHTLISFLYCHFLKSQPRVLPIVASFEFPPTSAGAASVLARHRSIGMEWYSRIHELFYQFVHFGVLLPVAIDVPEEVERDLAACY